MPARAYKDLTQSMLKNLKRKEKERKKVKKEETSSKSSDLDKHIIKKNGFD
jgi:hypothetical protein